MLNEKIEDTPHDRESMRAATPPSERYKAIVKEIEAEGGFETPEEYEKRMTIYHAATPTEPPTIKNVNFECDPADVDPEQWEEHMTLYRVPNCTKPDCKGCLAWFRKHFMDDIEDL